MYDFLVKLDFFFKFKKWAQLYGQRDNLMRHEKSDLRFLCSNINDILLIFSKCFVKDVFEKEIAAILRILNENIQNS